ncbi:MAG: S8 family serine peptidase, partial [Actinobacteria bacterium]|nr:S8 family peptidase [Actinomycetota bacterium]NIX22839.1 S8 family serine peptidase [Actinomycetota bacterium]
MHTPKRVALPLFLVLAWGCSSDGPPPETETLFRYVIDDSVSPVADELDSYDDEPRRVTGMADGRGNTGSFVAAEVIVADDGEHGDGVGLSDELAERYGAELLAELDSPAGLDMPNLYLFRVDLERAPDRFAEQVDELAEAAGIRPGADWRFEDEAGVKTFAVTIAEQAAGHMVTLNWVGEDDAIPDSTEEAPDGVGGYHDAYTFDWLNRVDSESSLKMGVPEAWSLMHLADSLDPGIRIAIIDTGFDPHGDALGRDNLDFGTVEAFSTHPTHGDALGGAGDTDWHGHRVASTAFALADNQFGSVGVAGPVIGEPILVYKQTESFSSARAVVESHSRGADIINMSYRIIVPAIGKFVVLPWTLATTAVRNAGTLIFSSAGNEGDDIDTESCFGPLICWEDWYHAPCEDPG